MDSVFIEIESTVFDTKSNIIVGVIYRMPDSSVDAFNEIMCDILNVVTKEKKICYLIGDINIDLPQHKEHGPTYDLVDILYTNNIFSNDSEASRVTDKSATLIDHILTNNFDAYSRHKQGIFIVLYLRPSCNMPYCRQCSTSAPQSIIKRDMRHQNIKKKMNMKWKQ